MPNPSLIPPISETGFQCLNKETLLSLTFGEGCLVEEYLFLHGLAAMLQPSTVLEIGTSFGVGSIVLAAGASAFGRDVELTTIDIRECPEFDSNIGKCPGLASNIIRVIGDSESILREFVTQERRFDLAFVDGAHDYPQVSTDWKYVRLLSDRFVLHDTFQMPGCKQLLSEIRMSGEFDVVAFEYPQGHQVIRNGVSGNCRYEGLYHQRQLLWSKGDKGPGIAIVERRRSE